MVDKFQEWLIRINGAEGGYANRNPKDDPGGETKWGISKRSYPHMDIRSLTVNDAAILYKKDFIEPLAKHNLPDGVTFQLLDFAVHSGIDRAVRYLQGELGVRADGMIGPQTQEAIRRMSESDLVMLIISARLEFLTHLDNWHANSRGWALRIAKNLRYGAKDTD